MSREIKNLMGEKFGRLRVVGLSSKKIYGRISWICLCNCGNKKIITGNSLQRENTKSCGCLHKEFLEKLAKDSTKNKKVSKAQKGKKNSIWAGYKVSLVGLHKWVRNNKPKPKKCEECNKVPPFDLANVSPKYNKKTYTRDFKYWRWLCRRCHMISDGRMKKFIKKKKSYEEKT